MRMWDSGTIISDSGNRREFDSGAVRDMAEGKGRCDLMPLRVIANILEDDVIYNIACAINMTKTVKCEYLKKAVRIFCADDAMWDSVLDLSKHFEAGAKKYGERNWEKGLPESCYIDSAIRHYLKYRRGDTDEPHDRAFLWNIVCLMWTIENIDSEQEATNK